MSNETLTTMVGANELETGMVLCTVTGEPYAVVIKVLDDFHYLVNWDATPEGFKWAMDRKGQFGCDYFNTQRGEEYVVAASTVFPGIA